MVWRPETDVSEVVDVGVPAIVVGSDCVLLMVLPLRLICCCVCAGVAGRVAAIRPSANAGSTKPVAMIAVLGSLMMPYYSSLDTHRKALSACLCIAPS